MNDDRTKALTDLLPELRSYAAGLTNDSYLAEDLFQEGCIAASSVLADPTPKRKEEALDIAFLRMEEAYREAEDLLRTDVEMVERVEQLDQSIDRLTERLHDKPTIDEIANEMGITQDELLSIIRLTGEEIGTEEKEEDHGEYSETDPE